jgi:hypothetical protein
MYFLLRFKHQPRCKAAIIHGGDVFVVEVVSSLHETGHLIFKQRSRGSASGVRLHARVFVRCVLLYTVVEIMGGKL